MQEQPSDTFWKKLDKLARHKHIPLSAMFELTYKCNFRCTYCYVPPKRKKEKDLSTKLVFSILDQLRDMGCLYLGFTGGEIFLRKDIFDILKHAKENGFVLKILTNASLIDNNIAEKLEIIAPNKIDITFHSMNKGTFDAITQVKGSYQKVFYAVNYLHQKGLSLKLKNCALKENEFDIGEVEKFANSLGASSSLEAGVVPRMDRSLEPLKHIPKANPNRFLSITAPTKSCGSKNIKKRKVFECGAGTRSLTISPKGLVKICQTIEYPNFSIPRLGLKKAWSLFSKTVKDIETKNKLPCNSCNLIEYCNWCPEASWLKFGNFTSCDEKTRQEAYQRSLKSKGYAY